MTIDRRLLAGAVGLALALSACGGASTASTAPASQPASAAAATEAPATAAPATAAPTAPAATEAPATAAPTAGGAQPSFVAGAAGDLEALLPDEINGNKLMKTSFDGASLGASGVGIDTGALGPLLKKYGKSVSDVRMALATTAAEGGAPAAMVVALQIKGVPAAELMTLTGSTTQNLKKTTIAGKDVLATDAGGFSVVVYPKDDLMFEIVLADAATTEAILSKLP
jgi:hypothetical protein